MLLDMGGKTSTSWKPGQTAPNGNRPLPERLAQRTIQQAFRELADPIDIGNALLGVFAGMDPFNKLKPPAENGMPRDVPPPIDWNHRLAAAKLFLEYSYGKPVQGHVVMAQIENTMKVQVEHSHTAELRSLTENNPEARALLRQLAATIAGAAATPSTPPPPATMTPVLDVASSEVLGANDSDDDADVE